MALSEEQIAELKSQHGAWLQLEVFDGPDGDVEIVLKPPTPVNYKRFLDERTEGKTMASSSMQTFVDACVVYPPTEEFKKIAMELSAVRTSLAAALQKMAGGMGARESKKL